MVKAQVAATYQTAEYQKMNDQTCYRDGLLYAARDESVEIYKISGKKLVLQENVPFLGRVIEIEARPSGVLVRLKDSVEFIGDGGAGLYQVSLGTFNIKSLSQINDKLQYHLKS